MDTPRILLPLGLLLLGLCACGSGKGADSFTPDAEPPSLAAPTADAGPDLVGPIGTALQLDGSGSAGVAFHWDFGDGHTAETLLATHTYSEPGNYTAILQVTGEDGSRQSDPTSVTAHRPVAAERAWWSADLQLSQDGSTAWAVLEDADTLARIDLTTSTPTATFISVGANPRGVALVEDSVGVVVEDSRALVILDAASGSERLRVELEPGTRPGELVGGPHFTVALTGTGEVVDVDADGFVFNRREVGPDPRALARTPTGELLVSRWRSPDETAVIYSPDATDVVLGLDERPDSDTTNRGVPNLLECIMPSPDGGWIYVPALQANVSRGVYRDGQALTFETAMRAIVSAVPLDTRTEHIDDRKVLDDRGRASFVLASPLGDLLYVAHPGFQTVSVLDGYTMELRGSLLEVGHTPNALALSPDGDTLYVLATLDRALHAFDVSNLSTTPPMLFSVDLVDTEPLSDELLQGKRLFHTSRDTRMAKSGYVTCSNCHPDGRQDGLVWDFTDRGEGFRNTISLELRGGTEMGRVHWTGNFDEIQDFEGDIRNGQGGTGLLTDGDWSITSDSLGEPKAGRSADLDALAAYVASISTAGSSPVSPPDGGEATFVAAGCDSCHPAPLYTDSTLESPVRHDVGTIQAWSGQRLGGELDGFDTPTLLGVHATGPWLHDGSAPTLHDAIVAHESAAGLDADTLEALTQFVSSL